MDVIVIQGRYEHALKISQLFNKYRVFCKQDSDLPLAKTFIAERLARNESVIFFAENNAGECLGFTQLYPSFSSITAKKSWIVSDLFVVKKARKQGVATELIKMSYQHAVKTGANGLKLTTAKKNSKAKALYESLGYVKDNVLDHYFLSIER